MKTISIPYKGKNLQLELGNLNVDVIRPIMQKNIEGEAKKTLLSKSFENTMWKEFISEKKDKLVLIVVNDATRATPTKDIVQEIHKQLERNRINYKYIIATGSHKKPSESDFLTIFGELYNKISDKIIVHDARDEQDLILLGKTSFGTPIYLNANLFDLNVAGIITINSIEPHYFAGWTGGRKSIVPGLAGYETIELTHKHTLSKESKVCKLEGNPVHDDLQEGFNMFLKDFSGSTFTFQAVVDSEGNVQEIFTGDFSIFKKGVEYAKGIFQVPIDHEYDLVIAVAYPPLDKSLYQAHKGLENSKSALNKVKSNFVLIASCEEGIGPDKYLEPFKININKENKYIMDWIENNYNLGYHKATKILESLDYCNLFIYSDIDPEISKLSRFTRIEDNLNDFIHTIIKKNSISNILIVLDACVTVPIIRN